MDRHSDPHRRPGRGRDGSAAQGKAGLYKINFDRYYSLQVAPVSWELVGHYGGFF